MALSRRLLIRLIGAPLLVAALCAFLYVGHERERETGRNLPVDLLVLVVAVLCTREIFAMCAARGIEPARGAGLLAVAASFVPWAQVPRCSFLVSGTVVAGGLLFYLLLMMVFRYGRLRPDGAAVTYFAFGYLGLLHFLTDRGLPGPQHTFYLLFLLAAAKGSDMAAFAVGKALGRHAMAPEVSPNKTWEGAIAGGLAGTAAGYAVIRGTPLGAHYAGVPAAALLFFCLIVTMAAQVGDLVKSAFKRWSGVKDSGHLLPEFGGMLDMVDSFILAAPVAAVGTAFLVQLF